MISLVWTIWLRSSPSELTHPLWKINQIRACFGCAPQRSCLGNKTEAASDTWSRPLPRDPPQRSCLGNKTEARQAIDDIRRSYGRLNEVASVTRPRLDVSTFVSLAKPEPQRSCLGNKTEATTTAVYLATALAAQPQRSCLGNKTEAGWAHRT